VSKIDERDPDFKRTYGSEDDVQLISQIRENDFDEDEEEDDKWLM
jgi:hypothetical protein